VGTGFRTQFDSLAGRTVGTSRTRSAVYSVDHSGQTVAPAGAGRTTAPVLLQPQPSDYEPAWSVGLRST